MNHDYFEPIGDSLGVNSLKYNSCKLLDFSLVVLGSDDEHRFQSGPREYAAVVLTGTVSITVGEHRFDGVGGRANVFAGKPTMVYVPSDSEVTISTPRNAEIALCSAPSTTTYEPYEVTLDDVTPGVWGTFNTTRDHNFLIDATRPSERLFVAEVTVASGNWATYPPHRHEVDDPDSGELFQEEMYFYRVEPHTGFGFAALYGDRVGGDNAFIVRHNTVHKMPAGYHTVAAAPGYRVWYLALFAGNGKAASPYTDPAHAWYYGAETALRNMQRVRPN